MAILGEKVNIEDLRIGSIFEFLSAKDANNFEKSLYLQARKKRVERPVFITGNIIKKNCVYTTLKVDSFKPIKSRIIN